MALKKIAKFNIKKEGSKPTDLSDYACFSTNEDGIWLVVDRNNNLTTDREGLGETDVTVFLKFGQTKVCAPGPPFDTNDGGKKKKKDKKVE